MLAEFRTRFSHRSTSTHPGATSKASPPVALVTGGSDGIGAACVDRFLAAGWRVAVAALPGPDLERTSAQGVVTTGGDLTCASVREAAVERTLKAYGRIDVLVNNAGVGLYGLATQVPEDPLRRLFEVNVFAPLALVQLVVPGMQRQGCGTIVNIGSVAGYVSLPWAPVYCASKSALHAFHDSLRHELRGQPIHLVKVCPGIVDTRFREHVLGGAAPPAVRDIRRIVTPDQVARRVLRAIERREKTVYVPRIGALFTLAGALVPSIMDLYLSRLLAHELPASAPLPTRYGTEEPS